LAILKVVPIELLAARGESKQNYNMSSMKQTFLTRQGTRTLERGVEALPFSTELLESLEIEPSLPGSSDEVNTSE
jgi:hypothetical protein